MGKSKLNFQNLNLLLIFILPIIFLFFGIKKQSELHEKLMVQGIAIDNENGSYKLTVQAYDFKNPTDKNEPKTLVVESSGTTVSEALENLKKITGLTPLYSQNKIIIFSQTLAKNGLLKITDFFSRYYEHRPSVKLRISKNTAGEMLKVVSENKLIKASEIRDLIDEKSDINILDFEKDIKTTISDTYLMVLEKNNQDSIKCEECAIFNHDKLIKFIDKNDLIALQILKNCPKPGLYTFSCNGNLISCKIENPKTKIKFIPSNENSNPEFEISTELDADLLENSYDIKDIKQSEFEIKKQLNQNLTILLEKAINDTIKERCDLFKFGKILRNTNPKYFKSIEQEWKDKILPNIKYSTKVESKIIMLGMNSR